MLAEECSLSSFVKLLTLLFVTNFGGSFSFVTVLVHGSSATGHRLHRGCFCFEVAGFTSSFCTSNYFVVNVLEPLSDLLVGNVFDE